MRRAVERGQLVPSTAARFTRRLPAPAPRRPGARRKNAFPNGWEIYGARTMAADKATRYALLPSLRSRCSLFPLTRTGLNNFYSLFGQTRCTMRRDVSILERVAPVCLRRIGANLQGSLTAIIPDESVPR